MRLKALAAVPLALAGWIAYGSWLQATMPKVEIRSVSPLAARSQRTLPFFELMSPLPELVGEAQAVPKLEYKKGPPERFLERVAVLFERDAKSPKERIIYYGRRSRTDLRGIGLLRDDPARASRDDSSREARYVELAIRASQGENVTELNGLTGILFRPFYLREAATLLDGIEKVAIMDQAGTPAFLFEAAPGDLGRTRSYALFVRRNAFYKVDYLGDRGFSLLNPERLFRGTFLTERRADALEYIARNLSEVKMQPEPKKSLSLAQAAWPILLLAAHVSVDPSALEPYFHFAGINALLYKSNSEQDLEVSDTFRNNVLSSDLYARDIAPEAPKTAEIARFARLLMKNFDQ